MIKIHTTLLFALCALTAFSQTSKEEIYADLNKSGGVYYAYPTPSGKNTPAPKGYKPFYISHYGRHGSRYLISDKDYTSVATVLRDADKQGALSPLGKDVMHRLDSLMVETSKRGGDLSPLGVRQHRGIAERMYRNYPEVFKGSPAIDSKSTKVVRCVLSMAAFNERLKELNPAIKIDRNASAHDLYYLNHSSEEANKFNDNPANYRIAYEKFEADRLDPTRFVGSLFTDSAYVEKNVRPTELMWGLYWIASDMQDVETDLDFYDIFLPDELFTLWECNNLWWYLSHVNAEDADGLLVGNAKPLVRNIIDSANEAIHAGENTATLRFGHDGNLMPLVCLLALDGKGQGIESWENAYESFADFKITPMAGNVQIVFFRNDKNPSDIIVKFLLNEEEVGIPIDTDIYPYYRWEEAQKYLESLL